MRSGFFNPNSQLAYDLFMQDRQRYFGTAEGGLTPDNPFRMGGGGGGGWRFQAPRAGVRQSWDGGGLTYDPAWSESRVLSNIGATWRGVGNILESVTGQRPVSSGSSMMSSGGGSGGGGAPMASGPQPSGGRMRKRDMFRATSRALRDKDTQLQPGETYFQARQRMEQEANMPPPPPTSPLPPPSNPMAEAYQAGQSRIQQAALRRTGEQMATTMTTPAAPNPMGEAYERMQADMRARQFQTMGQQAADVMTTPWNPTEQALPSTNPQARRRAGQRPPGLR